MPKRILIAEDDAFIADLYLTNLEKEGFTVELAKNGDEAVAAIDARQPDLLLLDMLMPKRDGKGVLLYKKEKGYTFPVVVLSSFESDIDPSEYESLGIKEYCQKTEVELNEVITIIKKYV